MHKGFVGSHPDLGCYFETEMGQAIGRHKSPIGATTCTVRFLRCKQQLTHLWMNAVWAHEGRDLYMRRILELRLHMGSMIDGCRELMAEMRRRWRHRSHQYVHKVG